MNQTQSIETLVESFDLMWGNHPGVVMLIGKNREILAFNQTGKALGLTPGIKCFTLTGGQKVCAHCQANQALEGGQAIRAAAWSEPLKAVIDGYWIPVSGRNDVYVHFGNDISAYAAPSMFPDNRDSAIG
jgi:cold shock CspA family protein